MDEALFLLRTEDDDVTLARSSQQEADQGLLEQYLEGVLPGEGVCVCSCVTLWLENQ